MFVNSCILCQQVNYEMHFIWAHAKSNRSIYANINYIRNTSTLKTSPIIITIQLEIDISVYCLQDTCIILVMILFLNTLKNFKFKWNEKQKYYTVATDPKSKTYKRCNSLLYQVVNTIVYKVKVSIFMVDFKKHDSLHVNNQ